MWQHAKLVLAMQILIRWERTLVLFSALLLFDVSQESNVCFLSHTLVQEVSAFSSLSVTGLVRERPCLLVLFFGVFSPQYLG